MTMMAMPMRMITMVTMTTTMSSYWVSIWDLGVCANFGDHILALFICCCVYNLQTFDEMITMMMIAMMMIAMMMIAMIMMIASTVSVWAEHCCSWWQACSCTVWQTWQEEDYRIRIRIRIRIIIRNINIGRIKSGMTIRWWWRWQWRRCEPVQALVWQQWRTRGRCE